MTVVVDYFEFECPMCGWVEAAPSATEVTYMADRHISWHAQQLTIETEFFLKGRSQ